MLSTTKYIFFNCQYYSNIHRTNFSTFSINEKAVENGIDVLREVIEERINEKNYEVWGLHNSRYNH